MRQAIVATVLCVCLLLGSCKTHLEQTSIFHQPNWWERRMDRLETWNLRHGYPIEKTKEAVLGTLIVGGTAACCIAYYLLGGESYDKRYHKTPFTDAYGYPLTN